MDIKYQTVLNNYPTITNRPTGSVKKLVPISLAEIVQLEATYNSANTFPQALRELLFLAGRNCYVLDFRDYDSQSEMQQDVRSWLTERRKAISRPFFAIDVYNGSDQFLFVYLDEDDDPVVREASLYNSSIDVNVFTHPTNFKLSKFIEEGIAMILSGHNPF